MKSLFSVIVFIFIINTPLISAFANRSVPGKALFEKNCTPCHSLGKSMNKRKTMESWQKVTERMRLKDPKLYSKEEGDVIARYLYSVKGKKKKRKVQKSTSTKKDYSDLSRRSDNHQKKLTTINNKDGHFNFKKLDIHQFIEPDQCASCHEEIFKQWTGSMHNNSFNDPFWKATTKLFAEEAKTKGAMLEIKACIKCHTPLGFRSDTITSAKDDFDNVPGIIKQGLFCNWCHNISEAKSIENANYELAPGGGEDDPSTMLGPLDDSKSDFHPSKFSELHTKSDFCGLCHNVSHALHLTPIENTYEEWKRGPYNTGDPKTTVHCQDCHMRQTPSIAATGKTERPDNPGFACSSGPKRTHVPTHYFVGGNTIPGDGFGNNQHQEMAVNRLKNAADIELIKSGHYRKSSMAVIKVKVINSGAGHYLPTGMSEMRQMWLDIKVKDSANRVIFSSGSVDKEGTIDPEAVMYNTVLGNSKGEPVINIAVADRVLKDYRIPPMGYVMEDYSFFIPGYINSPLNIDVTLRYRSSSQEFIDMVLKDKAPELPIIDMTTASLTIDI